MVTRASCAESAFRKSAGRFPELQTVEPSFDETQTTSDVVAAMQQLAQQVRMYMSTCRRLV